VISAVVALIFWMLDPMLGVIMAVVLPSVVAMDSTGDYPQVYVVVFLAFGLWFVRLMRDDKDEK